MFKYFLQLEEVEILINSRVNLRWESLEAKVSQEVFSIVWKYVWKIVNLFVGFILWELFKSRNWKISLNIFAHTQKSMFFMTEVHLYWGPLIPFQAINSTNLFPLSYSFFGGQKSELEEDPCISSKFCFKLIFF